MKRIKLQFINDSLLLLSLALALLSGLVLFVYRTWLFDLGIYSFLGLPTQGISAVHRWAGLAAVPFVVGHLVLYWRTYAASARAFVRRPKRSPAPEEAQGE